MQDKLTKKYGLLTAISMVVGIVIGSGVFFKAQDVLTRLQGNMPLGILAWLIGGAVVGAWRGYICRSDLWDDEELVQELKQKIKAR